ncbi:MAG: arylesterase [Pseudomonadota bacterium]
MLHAALAYGARGANLKRPAAALLAVCLGAAPVQADETFTIAALGDSLTHGFGLPQHLGFVPRLEAWLNDRSAVPVTVLNAGVSGDTTAGGRARLDWTLSDDVDGVIVELGGNDLLRGIDPAESRANLDAILAELSARGLPAILAGLPAPLNYGPEYKAAFDGMFPDLAGKYGAYLYPNFMAGISTEEDAAQLVGLMQPDGIHPNAEGVERIVAHIGPLVLRMIEEHAPHS